VINPLRNPDSRVLLAKYVLHSSLTKIDFHSMNVSHMCCVNASFIVCTNLGECVGERNESTQLQGFPHHLCSHT